MNKPNYIKELDGLRGIAILLVLQWHYTIGWHEIVAPYIWRGLSWTWSGVDLFFVLSGFLIGRILLYYKESPNYFKTFYARRLFRIFPLYYLVLVVYVIMLGFNFAETFPSLFKGTIPQFSYFLYLQNFYVVTEGFGAGWLSVTWSLAVEEQFYLLFPMLIYFTPNKWLPKAFLLGIVLAPICRALIGGYGAYVLLPSRMDTLLMGALIAFYHQKGYLTKALKAYKKHLQWTLFLLVIILVIIAQKGSINNIGGVFNHSFYVFFYGLMLVIVLLNHAKNKSSVLSHPLLMFIGKISYAVYLFHQIIITILATLILDKPYHWLNDINSIWVMLISLGVTFILASLSYFFFEKPLIKIGKRFNY